MAKSDTPKYVVRIAGECEDIPVVLQSLDDDGYELVAINSKVVSVTGLGGRMTVQTHFVVTGKSKGIL